MGRWVSNKPSYFSYAQGVDDSESLNGLLSKHEHEGCRTEKCESGSALMFPNASISGVGSDVSWLWKSALEGAGWYMINIDKV